MSSIWYSIIFVGLFTFLTRFSFIILSDKVILKPNAQRALRFVPIAVLSAIIIPELFQTNDPGYLYILPRLFAGIVATITALRTKNIVLTLVAGMLFLYLLNYLLIF